MLDNHPIDPDAFHGGHTPNAHRHVRGSPPARGDRSGPEETTDDHPARGSLTIPGPNGPHRSWSARTDQTNDLTDQLIDYS